MSKKPRTSATSPPAQYIEPVRAFGRRANQRAARQAAQQNQNKVPEADHKKEAKVDPRVTCNTCGGFHPMPCNKMSHPDCNKSALP
jgi:ribosomal protein L44E